MPDLAKLTCWVLSEGHAGMENQCVGLAEAIGVTPQIKRIAIRKPWTFLPAGTWPFPFQALKSRSDPLAPPWPDVLITCGRRSVPLSMAIRNKSKGKTFTVHIQDPTVAASNFDMITAPRHDDFTGDNVIVSDGALHLVTAEKLDREAARLAPLYADLKRPLVGVLIGGSNRRYKVTPGMMADLAARLCTLHETSGASFAVTPSRRTAQENVAALKEGLAGVPAHIWDGSGENPYLAILGLSDALIVTCDSISMVTEACSTGKPVYVVDFPGGSKRFHRFHKALREGGYARTFTGHLDDWTPPRLDERETIAGPIRNAIIGRTKK